MGKIYILTGANGHLGSTILRLQKKRGDTVRGLILPSEYAEDEKNIFYYKGDVCEKESLEPLFQHTGKEEVIVIHTAGMISIADKVSPKMFQVNVIGTKNIIELCKKYQVRRLVYVSSVHAIPASKQQLQSEVAAFSPDKVVGGYAKTKALATQYVLNAANEGLDAVVVHPSGIIGPYDSASNHIVQMVSNYMKGKLPTCVEGGYDFVDVRDVAKGCLAAAEKGCSGDCYILSNRYYKVKDILNLVKIIRGGRKFITLPIWMARLAIPFLALYSKLKKERPLCTRYSLYALASKDYFTHEKATSHLGYHPRDIYRTIKDTVKWITLYCP